MSAVERGNSKLLMICIHWFSKILFAILRKERDRECFWCLGGSFLFAAMNALHNCNALLYAMIVCIVCMKMVQKLAGQSGHLPALFLLDQARKSYDCQAKTSYSLCNFDKNSAKRGQYYVISDPKLTQSQVYIGIASNYLLGKNYWSLRFFGLQLIIYFRFLDDI